MLQSFTQSFHQNHQGKSFKMGQQVYLEKRKSKGSKVLDRMVALDQRGLVQVKNQKIIPYPQNFNMITRDEFNKLPAEEKLHLEWSKRQTSQIRIFFSRLQAEKNIFQSNRFSKPTAIYFDDVETGKRFSEFLKYQIQLDQQKQTDIRNSMFKLRDRVFKELGHKLIIQSVKQIIKIGDDYKSGKLAKDMIVAHNPDVIQYDQRAFKALFNQLHKAAQIKQDEQIQEELLRKIDKMSKYVPRMEKVQQQQIQQMINLWNKIANEKLAEQIKLENDEQQEIERFENQLQFEEEQVQEQVLHHEEPVVQHVQVPKEKEHKDIFLTNLRLIIDKEIILLKPIVRLQFNAKQSHFGKAILLDNNVECIFPKEQHMDDIFYLKQDNKGWYLPTGLRLEHYSLLDNIEISIYDEQSELADRVILQAQEGLEQKQVFLRQTRKLMHGQELCLRFQKHLNGIRRHYIRMDMSADFMREFNNVQWMNYPMLQLDLADYEHNNLIELIQENVEIINQQYMDLVYLPISVEDLAMVKLKQLVKQRRGMQDMLQQCKQESIECGLLMRGRSLVNSKWSQDCLIEAMELISDLEMGEHIDKPLIYLVPEKLQDHNHVHRNKYQPIWHYLSNPKLQDGNIISQNIQAQLVQACLRGFDYEDRLQLLPILLNSTAIILDITRNNQINYTLNNYNLFNELKQESLQYLEQEDQELNKLVVANHLHQFKVHKNNVWSEDIRRKLQQWQPAAEQLLNSLFLQMTNSAELVPLLFKLIQLFDQHHPNDWEGVLILMLSMKFPVEIPHLEESQQLEKLDMNLEQLFMDHLKTLWSGFFNFDAWLRVLDYCVGVGCLHHNQYSKAIGSVVGGILMSIDLKSIQSKQELQLKLKLYGELLCDPDVLIQNSFNCFQSAQFYNPNDNKPLMEEFIALIQQPSMELILSDQSKFDPYQDHIEELQFDVPEEHENSIYRDTEDQFYEQNPISSCSQYVYKPSPLQIHILIHHLNLHHITYGDTIISIRYKEEKYERTINEDLYFQFTFISNCWTINVRIMDKMAIFERNIDIRNMQFNEVHKTTEQLKDNYNSERHYFMSEIEYSLLVTSNQRGPLVEKIQETMDYSVKQFLQSFNIDDVIHSAFTPTDHWKRSTNMNYAQFKQFMVRYYQVDANKFNTQNLYASIKNEHFYLADFLIQFTLHTKMNYKAKCDQYFQIIRLFSASIKQEIFLSDFKSFISQIYLSLKMPLHDHLAMIYQFDVRFIKVTISDETNELVLNMTDQFNQYLINNYKHYNNYDLLLFDQNNRFHLQPLLSDIQKQQLNQSKSQIVYLRFKFIRYGWVRKVVYTLTKELSLTQPINTEVVDVKTLLQQNQRILALNNKITVNSEEFYNIMSRLPIIGQSVTFDNPSQGDHLAYFRSKDGSKQLKPCNIVGKIICKTGNIKYLVVHFIHIDKKVVVYKEEVIQFEKVDYEEVETIKKPWSEKQNEHQHH